MSRLVAALQQQQQQQQQLHQNNHEKENTPFKLPIGAKQFAAPASLAKNAALTSALKSATLTPAAQKLFDPAATTTAPRTVLLGSIKPGINGVAAAVAPGTAKASKQAASAAPAAPPRAPGLQEITNGTKTPFRGAAVGVAGTAAAGSAKVRTVAKPVVHVATTTARKPAAAGPSRLGRVTPVAAMRTPNTAGGTRRTSGSSSSSGSASTGSRSASSLSSWSARARASAAGREGARPGSKGKSTAPAAVENVFWTGVDDAVLVRAAGRGTEVEVGAAAGVVAEADDGEDIEYMPPKVTPMPFFDEDTEQGVKNLVELAKSARYVLLDPVVEETIRRVDSRQAWELPDDVMADIDALCAAVNAPPPPPLFDEWSSMDTDYSKPRTKFPAAAPADCLLFL
ncbi:hypothetical protein DFJ73DRAFT_756040 [Zopfochytrium polystomum]|nr:hypothetical protein DFJ73DRAFT_756040 [Zopfochytrium polystomum]